MKTYKYANEYEEYEIVKFNNEWVVMQDGVFSNNRYKTLKDAKRGIDNQEIYF